MGDCAEGGSQFHQRSFWRWLVLVFRINIWLQPIELQGCGFAIAQVVHELSAERAGVGLSVCLTRSPDAGSLPSSCREVGEKCWVDLRGNHGSDASPSLSQSPDTAAAALMVGAAQAPQSARGHRHRVVAAPGPTILCVRPALLTPWMRQPLKAEPWPHARCSR